MTDWALTRQLDRRWALLQDIARSGGIDNWDHLRSHGHHHATLRLCIRAKLVVRLSATLLQITEDGRQDIHGLKWKKWCYETEERHRGAARLAKFRAELEGM